MRKLLAVAFLVAVAAAIWFGARWMAGRSDVDATVVFPAAADGLAPGTPVVAGSLVIGEVTRVTPAQGQVAADVRIHRRYRDRFLVDSRFSVEGAPPVLRVGSTLAFGRPVDDGEVLYARPSRLTGWVETQAARLGPLVDLVKERAGEAAVEAGLDRKIEEWSAKIPDWQAMGEPALREKLAAVEREAREAEAKLRAAGRDVDADALRRKFDDWLARVRRSLSDDPPPSPAPAQP